MDEKKNLEPKNSNKKKILLIAVLAILAVALIVLAVVNSSKNKGTDNSDMTNTNQPASSQTENNNAAPATNEATTNSPASEVSGAPTTPATNETPAVVDDLGQTPKKAEAPIEKTEPITIKMTIDAEKGFNPSTLDVKAGQQVTLNVTANGGVAILVFDGGLSATATGISNGQTKDITFNAPVTRGAYSFHNDVPGRNQSCKINVK